MTTKPNLKVRDLAAMFGSQIATKKTVKRVPKTKSRRGSETLRLQRNKLKTVTKDIKDETSDTDDIFNAVEQCNSDGFVKGTYVSPDRRIDYDIEHCDFDAVIQNAYCTPKHSRRGSHSSLSALSVDLDDMVAIDFLPLECHLQQGARDSECEDTTPQTPTLTIERSAVITEDLFALLMSDTDTDTAPIDYQKPTEQNTNDRCSMTGDFVQFELDLYNIGEIGAIKTSDYVKTPKKNTVVNDIFASSQYFIESEDEYYSGQEMDTFDTDSNEQISAVTESADEISVTETEEYNKESANMSGSFHETRERQIGMDLMHLMMSDSGSDDFESDDMCVCELLEMFGLFLFSDRNIYSYFSDVLCIQFVYQMMDEVPSRITRPKDCFDMKQLKKLNRLVKYVSVQCGNNVWNGKYSKQWIGLESNTIYNIWQCKSEVLLNHSEYANHYKSIMSSHKSDIISLNGFEKKYTHLFDINQLDQETVLKLIIKDLPNKYRFENKLFKFGIETNDGHTLDISDRLNIRKDDCFLESMFVGTFVENCSFVFMKLKMIKSTNGRVLNINFSHQPNMQITQCDHSEFSKDYHIKIEQNTQTCRIYLEQYNALGRYIIDQ